MKNIDIRSTASQANVNHWEISDHLGMRESNFSRMLRYELSEEQKEIIRIAIAEVKEERSKQ